MYGVPFVSSVPNRLGKIRYWFIGRTGEGDTPSQVWCSGGWKEESPCTGHSVKWFSTVEQADEEIYYLLG